MNSAKIQEHPALVDTLHRDVNAMKQVISRDGMRCFAMQDTVGVLKFMKKAVEEWAESRQWKVEIESKPVVPPWMTAPGSKGGTTGSLATLNLHGLAGKRQELILTLEANNAVAVALQETRRDSTKLASVWRDKCSMKSLLALWARSVLSFWSASNSPVEWLAT